LSLYGTGRAEGFAAATLVATLVLATRVLGIWLGDESPWLAALMPAWLPALGGMLAYRFLRAQGRSRYAAFLVGAAYGLSPWLLAMHCDVREQLAAALAPLALEAACRLDRPSQRARWAPWAWVCFAAPFAAGPTVVGTLAAALCGAAIVRTLTCGSREDDQPAVRSLVVTALLGALAAANLAWLDVLGPWLSNQAVPAAGAILGAHRPEAPGFDAAALLRVPGALLLTFAVLGVLRRQRHVDTSVWLTIAIVGALPTLVAAFPGLGKAAPTWASHAALPATAWWLSLLGVAVLAAAGLDDFLDLPLRRRTALPWLLAIAVAAAPWLPAFASRVPEREWPLTATFVALPVVLVTWRRLGILRFKNWLAAVALVALAIPPLQLRTLAPMASVPPPAPLGEVARPASPWAALQARPLWHYAGVSVALLGGCLLAASALRRSRHASPKPTSANAAIVKKARPSQRS
jgi:hypothetical protein